MTPRSIHRRPAAAMAGLAALILTLSVAGPAAGQNLDDVRLLAEPGVSATHIAFQYDGDLWVAGRDGAGARRITTVDGDEVNPKFSPDGRWLAFTGEYDGNADVYIVPVEGGVPTRLTWHPGFDLVRDWTPDGDGVLFLSQRSTHTNRHAELFIARVDGGMPEELPIPSAYTASFSPDGSRIAYTPLAEAMGAYPSVFPNSYRALVRSGERGGSLASVLDHLHATADLDDRTSRLAAAHVMYPALLLGILSVVFAFYTIFIIPKFRIMFEEMEVSSRGATEAMAFAARSAPLALLALLVATLLLGAPQIASGLVRKFTPGLAGLLSWINWHMPFLSRLERRRAAAGYSLAASRLLAGGVPVDEALTIAADASGNRHFERIALAAAGRVAEGQKLSEALAAEARPGEVPPDLLWFVELGEASGRLPEALSGAADTSFARTQSILKSLVSLIFPLGVIMAGLMVGVICYSVFDTLVCILEGVTP